MKRSRVMMMTAVLLIGMAVWLPGLRSRRVAAVGPALSGTYSFSITIPYAGNNNVTGTIQSTVTLDGAGSARASGGVSVVVDPDPNATSPLVHQLSPSSGNYTVNPDGTGTASLTDSDGNVSTLSFATTDGGTQLMVVVTSGLGDVVGTGIARKQ